MRARFHRSKMSMPSASVPRQRHWGLAVGTYNLYVDIILICIGVHLLHGEGRLQRPRSGWCIFNLEVLHDLSSSHWSFWIMSAELDENCYSTHQWPQKPLAKHVWFCNHDQKCTSTVTMIRIVTGDGLAPLGGRASADAVIIQFMSFICKQWRHQWTCIVNSMVQPAT